jgi:2-polyprenyl-3-methyl-5-hydroxy-6-metoxy-1,4-benzoquinol methylase
MTELTIKDLQLFFGQKYGAPSALGWGPRTRLRFNYFTPDDLYEATVARLVTRGCSWLDVGCGRDIFPGNEHLAGALAGRCGRLVGVDPSDNIDQNPFLHERAKVPLEHFQTGEQFDLVTFRMVVEHVERPAAVLETLSRVVKPGGKVAIFTVNKWSPVPLAAKIVPFGAHHAFKAFLWRTEERDTFPVVYAMNTRRQLKRLFHPAGFREYAFSYLDDCRTFARFPFLNRLELITRTLLRKFALPYPENCLLGIYERVAENR